MAQSRSIVRPYGDPLVGQSPTDLRLAQAALLARASLSAWGVRPGVLWGGTVRGTAGWAYEVDPAALVMSRGALQGAYPAVITGVQSVPTDPAPGSGSRIDIVYVLQQDPDLGDLGNDPLIACARGVASGAPVAPALPAGALELGRATITSLMTQTLDATVASTAPITALHGAAFEVPSVAALSRVVGAVVGAVARVGTASYVYSGSTWWDQVGRRQVLTGTGVLAAASGATFNNRIAVVDYGADGSKQVNLTLDGSSVPYVSGSGSATWGTLVASLRTSHHTPVQFAHNSNVGLGKIDAGTGIVNFLWGTFVSSGSTVIGATANYTIPAS